MAGTETRGDPKLVDAVDVFIAGSGPIGCTFARKILDNSKKSDLTVLMIEMGSQDNPVIGRHHKNSAKYQKDIDAFVNVIKGALQPVSVPPAATYMPTLGAEAWSPGSKPLVSAFNNPEQEPSVNLPGCAVTRTVGGMATHWTCACPIPHPEEREASPLPKEEFLKYINEAGTLLNVNLDQYDLSVRHNLVKKVLQNAYGEDAVKNLPLAVKRRKNRGYVTWSGSDTVLGETYSKNGSDKRFTLLAEHRIIGFVRENSPLIGGSDKESRIDYDRLRDGTGAIKFAYVKDIIADEYLLIPAKYFVVACGAIGTPQVLWNSGFGLHLYDNENDPARELPALGRYLTEQSISFCQIVLKRKFIENIEEHEDLLGAEHRGRCAGHKAKFPDDPIHIPFSDPEPQVTIPYTTENPWHTQIHRDAFSYGDVGPRADPRLIVDLRFFGRQAVYESNYVTFSNKLTDIYGMPQPTFNVVRKKADAEKDSLMMSKMCEVAGKLGEFLPGSYPQFMAPGLALHITVRIRTAPYKPIKTKLVFDLTRRYSAALFYELCDHTCTHWPMMSVAADGIMTHVEQLNSNPVGRTLSTWAPLVYAG
ncbi:GMC oxidoreductase [Rhizoctonia solani]|uniref:GMC oxidoreductase n=1 Tax=Rhizoctonia solani TaxID=456999 RepID=A0A8H8P071_9AGAM|nr:GMC oxidoreductase [Rhizoctonia solani]QRW21546.1 GMC oxidoreductase [Rhizoctonia solani]